MGFSLKGVFGFNQCEPCRVGELISNLLGTEVPLAFCLAAVLLCCYSLVLVLVGRHFGRRTPLVTIVRVGRGESRFAIHGAERMSALGEENTRRRHIHSSSGEENW